MTVPSNSVQQQGLGAQSADEMNTDVQTVASLATLRAFVGTGQMEIALQGYATQGDGGQGVFVWNATATGPDNGTTVIVPIGSTVGAWVRNDPVAGTPPPPSGFVPYAAQMSLTDDVSWAGQVTPDTFWVPWTALATTSAPTPAYNPDGVASLTTVCPTGSPMFGAFGATGPGFTIPVTGVYQVYTYLNLAYAEVPGPGPLDGDFEIFIESGASPWPTNGQVLNSNERPGILVNGPNGFFNVNIAGGLSCVAGDVVFMGIVDNSLNNGAHLTVTQLSYFGIYRVR